MVGTASDGADEDDEDDNVSVISSKSSRPVGTVHANERKRRSRGGPALPVQRSPVTMVKASDKARAMAAKYLAEAHETGLPISDLALHSVLAELRVKKS